METIYPEETLKLLAKCDSDMEEIRVFLQRHYPDPMDYRCALLEDPTYHGLVMLKAKIISLSTCTYLFNADEAKQLLNKNEDTHPL